MSALVAFALFGTLAQEPAVKVIEQSVPNSGRICVQAVIKLPPMSPREWGALLIIRDAMADGTKGYTGFDLLNYVTAAGDPMKITLANDHLRIGYALPPGNLAISSDILEELLDKAYLNDEKLKKIAEETPFLRMGPWEQTFSAWRPDFSELKRDDILRVYRRVFRPEQTTVAVSGDFAKGEGEKEFTERFSDWKPENPGRRRILEGKPGPAPQVRGTALTSIGADVTAAPAELLLAAYALGVGKGAAAFRVVREELRLSYRQEALLIPAEKGWRLALMFQHTGEIDKAKLKEALKKDIEGWTPETLDRAKGMMSASFDFDLGGLPICLNPRGPLTLSLEDRTYWQAYIAMKTGTALDIETMRLAARELSLQSLKATALAWVDAAQ